MTLDPKRIVEDEGAGPLAAMLRAARDDGLTQEEVGRIRAGVAATIAAGAGTTALGAKQLGLRLSLPAKLGLALAVIGIAAGGASLARRDFATVAAPPAAPSDGTTAPLLAVTANPSPPEPSSDPATDPATSVPSAQEADLAAGPPATAGPQAPRAAPHPWRPAPAASTAPRSATPANEGALLLEARRVLQDDPARAMELVHQHERQFPNSQLAPERARIEAEAAKRSPR
jgi:hypothetical protein